MDLNELRERYTYVSRCYLSDTPDAGALFFLISHQGKMGMYRMDEQRFTIPLEYDLLEPYYPDDTSPLYYIERGGVRGLINATNGTVYVPLDWGYKIVELIHTGGESVSLVYIVSKTGQPGSFGVVNVRGEVLVPLEYEFCEKVGANFFIYGEEVINNEYVPRLIYLVQNGKGGVYDLRGKSYVVPPEFDEICHRFDHRFMIILNNRVGTFDTLTQTVTWDT